jgi:hypothetical protein
VKSQNFARPFFQLEHLRRPRKQLCPILVGKLAQKIRVDRFPHSEGTGPLRQEVEVGPEAAAAVVRATEVACTAHCETLNGAESWERDKEEVLCSISRSKVAVEWLEGLVAFYCTVGRTHFAKEFRFVRRCFRISAGAKALSDPGFELRNSAEVGNSKRTGMLRINGQAPGWEGVERLVEAANEGLSRVIAAANLAMTMTALKRGGVTARGSQAARLDGE